MSSVEAESGYKAQSGMQQLPVIETAEKNDDERDFQEVQPTVRTQGTGDCQVKSYTLSYLPEG